jgi:hypothetical protein
MEPSPEELEDPSPRFANLQRAARFPWTDDGHCVVREASNEWPVLAERCYASRERGKPKAQTRPSNEQEPVANREPTPRGLGRDWLPPDPPVSSDPRDRRPECTPRRASHRGGNDPHNKCADKIPNNSFPGWDVLVNGKHFDDEAFSLVLIPLKVEVFQTKDVTDTLQVAKS